MRLAILSIVFLAYSNVYLDAGLIVKDHVTNAANWDGLPLITHEYPLSLPTAASGAAATFVGNGQFLKTVSAVFAHQSFQGEHNQGNPESLEFRFSFHATINEYVDDPFLENASSPNTFHRFDKVSNLSSWLNVVGESDDGHHLFVWELDVEPLGIQTVAGATHVVSILPETNGASGPTLVPFSNGSNAIGAMPDWFTSSSLGPATLPNLNAPFDNAAYRVTTTAIPEPPSCLLVAVAGGLLFAARRIRNRFRIHRASIHNTAVKN